MNNITIINICNKDNNSIAYSEAQIVESLQPLHAES